MILQVNKERMISLLQIKRHVVILLVAAVSLMSCTRQSAYYHEFSLVGSDGWQADSACVFHVDMKDTVNVYELTVQVRHTSAYPYQNLWLFVKQQSPDGQFVQDTISCVLADHTGKWFGTGTGSVYLLAVPLRKQYRFEIPGVYQYTIVQGMRDETLKGIQAIGIKLENQHGEE